MLKIRHQHLIILLITKTYLYNHLKRITHKRHNFGPVSTMIITSGAYNKGIKKYVNVSLGGRGFSVADGVLLYRFSLGSITPPYALGSNDSVTNYV